MPTAKILLFCDSTKKYFTTQYPKTPSVSLLYSKSRKNVKIPHQHIPHRTPTDSELDELYAMLVGYAARHTDSFDEALDMVQEALTTTLERTHRLGNVENFKAYCFQVLRSKLALRGKYHALPLEAATLPLCEQDSCFDFILDETLRHLPIQEQAVVRAHDLEGEDTDAIARRMKLSESYVCKLLSQGHTRLKTLLKKK